MQLQKHNLCLSNIYNIISLFCLEDLIDVTLADDDAYSKVVDIVADADVRVEASDGL